MDIVEFFEQSSGKWFSQRTSHHLAFKQTESGKSDIVIDLLSKDDPAVVALCQQYEIDPALALCGARVTWDGTMEWDKEKHEGSTVIVPVADADQPNEGKMLREQGYAEKAPVAGRYVMGDDDSLTLITEYETMYSEERLWFASPNLRLRTSILKRFGGFSMATFCSEIRMGGAK
ncbi:MULTISPECIES: phycobiliprotein lyase [Cyanophyceae]|uniref:Chromophore lyase CpcS/CpeS n=1 Tax=Thermoleptolyngbya oregonensis NK1-22 TaxID=2547457 RepID=A0AA96Y0W2_9CYAN|nr:MULTISPECIES: phycobiliprotein lyase [Cyanophyceae]MBF2086171.1 phycobiliprotein lyase [Thermoleptolyngbya sp. C42_A2020_037]WOB42092.1 phycobiliprotein lyase [Thermoleptolyngbya oregonensis NK1-22]BAU41196.1 Chromophore lyase CpcS/CpeS [Leptolyngbya sp. O-77]HIK40248.1 phycobiliprotein lyase [Thermoleptolyngbya sp. M55_K2018_002]